MAVFTTLSLSSLSCQLNTEFDYSVSNHTAWFNDLSTVDEGAFLTTWLWDFGDGATGTYQFPVHVYPGAGIYDVCLTVLAAEGDILCEHIWCTTVEIAEEPLCFITAGFTSTLAEAGEVQFIQQASGNAFTDVVAWHWSFGDGEENDAVNPTHTYMAPITANVCLTATGEAFGNNCFTVHCHEIAVSNFPCELEIEIEAIEVDNCLFEFAPVVLTGAWTTVTGYEWTFDNLIAAKENISYVFNETGAHDVCLTVTADAPQGGCTQTWCEVIETICIPEQLVSVDESSVSSFILYPIPAVDIVFIQSYQALTQITIYDLMGRPIYHQTSIEGTTPVDLHFLPGGNYVVKMVDVAGHSSSTLMTKI